MTPLDTYLPLSGPDLTTANPKDLLPPRGPTPTDYNENGFFVRYFARNLQNQAVFEIRDSKVSKFKRLARYRVYELKWRITGPEFDVLGDQGQIQVPGVVDTNRRQAQRFPELGITNFRKWWRR